MAGTFIHPLAVVETGAELGQDVHVGPFCHIGGEVTLGDGSRLHGNVTIMGSTSIGSGALIFPGAVVGAPPQSHKHKGEPTRLTIGANATIRESATLHTGTVDGRGETTVGDNLYLMVNAHVGHDCIIGNHVTMANTVSVGGHVEIGDHVNMGGHSAVHQFVRIGAHSFIGGMAAVVGDVIPYAMVYPGEGSRGRLRGFNVIGLKRAGMGTRDLARLRTAYRQLFEAETPLAENVEQVARDHAGFEPVQEIVQFLTNRGKRIYTMPARSHGDQASAEG